jgi:hypothetical protein
VLIKDRRPVARLEGRVSAPQIERMIAPHLPLSKPRQRSPSERGRSAPPPFSPPGNTPGRYAPGPFSLI